MKLFLFFFLIIILLIVVFSKNEHFSYKLKDLSVSNDENTLQVYNTRSVESNVKCEDIALQNECDSHQNVCSWVEQGSDYKCISKCDTEILNNDISLCNSNEHCEYNIVNNTCSKKGSNQEAQEEAEDVCNALDTISRCATNSNCVFVEGKCSSINLDGSAMGAGSTISNMLQGNNGLTMTGDPMSGEVMYGDSMSGEVMYGDPMSGEVM